MGGMPIIDFELLQGVVIVRKRKGSFCSSSFGWRSELLHV